MAARAHQMDQALFRSVGARAGGPENAGGLVSTNPDTVGSRTYPATSLGSMGSTSPPRR